MKCKDEYCLNTLMEDSEEKKHVFWMNHRQMAKVACIHDLNLCIMLCVSCNMGKIYVAALWKLDR